MVWWVRTLLYPNMITHSISFSGFDAMLLECMYSTKQNESLLIHQKFLSTFKHDDKIYRHYDFFDLY